MPVWCNWQTQLIQNQFKLRVRFSPQVPILSDGAMVAHTALNRTIHVRVMFG